MVVDVECEDVVLDVEALDNILAVGAIGLLGVTLLLAETQNGAKNWLSLGGISVQPSELAKFAVILQKISRLQHYEKKNFYHKQGKRVH